MKPRPLPITQRNAIYHMQRYGGELVKVQRGVWTYPTCPEEEPKPFDRRDRARFPKWWVLDKTVEALIEKSAVVPVEFADGEKPIKVALPR